MDVFFKSWDSLARVFITIFVAYPGLIILLRVFGKRSLSKLNMFDFIITVALGSTFASVVLSRNVTIVDGLMTLMLMLAAQFIITWLSLRSSVFDHLIKSEPTLVFHNGEFLKEEMIAVRLKEEEVYAEIRQKGIACMQDVYAVVLETNGVISVLQHKDDIVATTLQGVGNYKVE